MNLIISRKVMLQEFVVVNKAHKVYAVVYSDFIKLAIFMLLFG